MKALLFGLLAMISTHAMADAGASNVYCQTPEYRQFDFWVGNWASYDKDGVLQGYNRVEKIEHGCALQEYWRGLDGTSGTSFSIYDKNRKVWNQTWVSSRGTLLPIEGALVDNSIVLTGNHVNDKGVVELHRTTWTHNADGSVYQRWDFTVDGGQHWEINYEGTLRPTDKQIQ